jgi:hypothetical protein
VFLLSQPLTVVSIGVRTAKSFKSSADGSIDSHVILDLNITSPDTARATTTRGLSRSAGDMFLYLELWQAVITKTIGDGLDPDGCVIPELTDQCSQNSDTIPFPC